MKKLSLLKINFEENNILSADEKKQLIGGNPVDHECAICYTPCPIPGSKFMGCCWMEGCEE